MPSFLFTVLVIPIMVLEELGNLPHRPRQLGKNTRVRKHGQTRHGTMLLVRLEKFVNRRTQLKFILRVRNSHDNLRTQKSVCRMELGEGITISEDRVAHERHSRLGTRSGPRC